MRSHITGILILFFGLMTPCAHAVLIYNPSVAVIPQHPGSADTVLVNYQLETDYYPMFKQVAQRVVGEDLQVVIALYTAGPGLSWAHQRDSQLRGTCPRSLCGEPILPTGNL